MARTDAYPLHRSELLAPLQRGDEKIRGLMGPNRRQIEAGATLVSAGSDHPYVYRIRTGWAGRVRTLEDGRSQFILLFLPGDLFAVKSMFVDRHPDAIEMLAEGVLEQIDYRALRKAYEEDSDIALRCTWQVVEEERRLHTWVVSLGRGSAEERLAFLLIEFRGRLVLSGSIHADAREYRMPLTQEQLGDHVGISVVHVNRVLKTFREAGIATVRNRKVTISDNDALTEIARPLMDVYDRTAPAYVEGNRNTARGAKA